MNRVEKNDRLTPVYKVKFIGKTWGDALNNKEEYDYELRKSHNEMLKQEMLMAIQEDKNKEINRLNNIIDELEDLITIKISRASNEEDYDIEIDDMIELKDKLNELKGDNK